MVSDFRQLIPLLWVCDDSEDYGRKKHMGQETAHIVPISKSIETSSISTHIFQRNTSKASLPSSPTF